MQVFFHILLFHSCIQDQPGQAHDMLSHEIHVSHKPARNSQNHNISCVILLGFIPTPMQYQLQTLTRKKRHGTFWFQAFHHSHYQQHCSHVLTIYHYFSSSLHMLSERLCASYEQWTYFSLTGDSKTMAGDSSNTGKKAPKSVWKERSGHQILESN